MTPDELRTYLRELQKNPYNWPNDYFAWEKPDKTLFMIGISSTQQYQIIIHEMNKKSFQNQNRIHFGVEPEYSSVLYGISPNIGYYQAHLNGPSVKYDPVEKIVNEVSNYRYLGTWRDPDRLMESPYTFSKVLACGRWDLAKKHILDPERKPSLSEQITKAQNKTSEKEAQAGLNTPSHTHPKKDKEAVL